MIFANTPALTQPIKLMVTEIYLSVQGESTWAGLPCTFIRLTGCPLRCTYCDTEYAFYGGTKLELADVVAEVRRLGCLLVEVTGGEPLAQPNCIPLLRMLVEDGYTVLLETSGALPLDEVPREVHKIMDLKCPSSGEADRNDFRNLSLLSRHDQIKFVMGTREDYDWARQQIDHYGLTGKCGAVLFSCVFGELDPATLVKWMLEDKLFEVRMQLQAHKFIWPPETKGV